MHLFNFYFKNHKPGKGHEKSEKSRKIAQNYEGLLLKSRSDMKTSFVSNFEQKTWKITEKRMQNVYQKDLVECSLRGMIKSHQILSLFGEK